MLFVTDNVCLLLYNFYFIKLESCNVRYDLSWYSPCAMMPVIVQGGDMVTDKDKALELAISQIVKQYGEGTVMKLGELSQRLVIRRFSR